MISKITALLARVEGAPMGLAETLECRNIRYGQNQLTFVCSCYDPFQIMVLHIWEVTVGKFHTPLHAREYSKTKPKSPQLNYHVT